jgi:hypothetical protein
VTAQNALTCSCRDVAAVTPHQGRPVLEIKGRLPWVEKRRSNLLAITFPGTSFEPSEIVHLTKNITLKDNRGRPLIWEDATIGRIKKKIQCYLSVS